jgi:hypothetical protein
MQFESSEGQLGCVGYPSSFRTRLTTRVSSISGQTTTALANDGSHRFTKRLSQQIRVIPPANSRSSPKLVRDYGFVRTPIGLTSTQIHIDQPSLHLSVHTPNARHAA